MSALGLPPGEFQGLENIQRCNELGPRHQGSRWTTGDRQSRAQRNLAEVYAHLEAMRVMNARMSWQFGPGRNEPGVSLCH